MVFEAAGVRLPGRQYRVLKAAPDKWQPAVKHSADIDSWAAATKPWKNFSACPSGRIIKWSQSLKEIYCAKLMITGLNGRKGTASQWLKCLGVAVGMWHLEQREVGTTDTIILCTLLTYRDPTAVRKWQMQQVGEPIDRFVVCAAKRWRTHKKNNVHTFMDEN